MMDELEDGTTVRRGGSETGIDVGWVEFFPESGYGMMVVYWS